MTQLTNSDNIEAPALPPKDKPVGKSFRLSGTGTEVYMTSGGTTVKPKQLIVLLTNSLGLSSKNNLFLADKYAKEFEVFVAMPDLFEGDPVTTGGAVLDTEPIPSTSSKDAKPGPFSLLAQVKTFAVSTVKGFIEDMWSARHTFSHTLPLLQDTISELLAIYKPTKVAVIGYSFGAKYVLHLLSQAPLEITAGYDPTAWTATDDALREADNEDEYEAIVGGVVIHPSLLDPKDFQKVSKPFMLVYSKDDDLLPESLIQKGIRVLETNKRKNPHIQGRAFSKTSVYDNEKERYESNNMVKPLPHGFAVPGDYPPNVVGDRPEKVLNSTVEYLKDLLA